MPTYEYETITKDESAEPTRFEVWQSLAEEPLTEHPETGQPVRRILSAGLAVRSGNSGCCEAQCDCG